MNERRSRITAEMQLPLFTVSHAQGVGARQAHSHTPGRGGGYLHECSASVDWSDAKIRELADLGLPQVWLTVAQQLGYDQFLVLWRILDSAMELRSESDSMIDVKLRRFSSFRRYQRNRFIEALVEQGLTARQIRAEVKARMGEELSERHICTLASKGRIKP